MPGCCSRIRQSGASDEPNKILLEDYPPEVLCRLPTGGLLHLQHHGVCQRHYGEGAHSFALFWADFFTVGLFCHVLCGDGFFSSRAVLEGVLAVFFPTICANERVGPFVPAPATTGADE